MKVILAALFSLFVLAGTLSCVMGLGYLLSTPENVLQQQAQGSLATAFFVLTLICWWVASACGRAARK